MMRHTLALAASGALLAACGGNADQLDEAANQSDPAAAQVINQAAEAQEAGEPINAQEVLQDAGKAQLGTAPAPFENGTAE